MVRGRGLAPHLLRHHVGAPDGPLPVVVPAQARLGRPRRAGHGRGLTGDLLVQQLLGPLRPHHVQGSLGLGLVKTGRFWQ